MHAGEVPTIFEKGKVNGSVQQNELKFCLASQLYRSAVVNALAYQLNHQMLWRQS